MFRATRVYVKHCIYMCALMFFLLSRWHSLVEVRQADGDSPRSSASRTIPIHPHTRQPGVYTHICFRGFVNSRLNTNFCTLSCLFTHLSVQWGNGISQLKFQVARRALVYIPLG